MALLDNIKSLQYSGTGAPWVRISASPTQISIDSLQFSNTGEPWWGLGPASSGWKIYIGGTVITGMYVGNTAVTTAYIGTNILTT